MFMKLLSFFKKHTLLLSIIFFFVLITTAYVVKIKRSEAALGVPFGGLVLWEYPCTCSPGTIMVYLSLPRPGLYAVNPTALGPLLFLDKVIAPGSWLLGSYAPGVQSCIMYYGVTCAPFPVLGTITSTGTSL